MSIERRRDPFTHLTGGAICGMTACIILQPLDLIKTRLQQSVSKTQPYRRSILLATVKDIIQKNGVTGLWRGTVPTVVRNVPGTAMYFTTLSEVRNLMKSMRPFWPSTIAARDCEKWENLLSGVIARGAVGYIMMPVTVVKVRYESNIYNYQRMSEAFRSIIKYDGVRGLFAGYGATFIRDAPFAGIYLFFYEQCKTLINAWKDQQSVAVANVAVNLSSGVVAGTAATCITQPFDLMKTRMQLNPHVYRNTLYTAKRVLMENGIKGFFDGISLRLARKPLSSAISWAIYEEVVRFLAHRQPVSQTAV